MKDELKSMLTNLINEKPEEAQLNFHNYLQAKMRDMVQGKEEVAVESSNKTEKDGE